MNVSFGKPSARYDVAVERSPRESAVRYERTIDAARSLSFAPAPKFETGVDVGAGERTGDDTGPALAAGDDGAAVIADVLSTDGAAEGVTNTTAGVGDCVGIADGDGDGVTAAFDSRGAGDGVADGVSSASGVSVGAAVGIGVTNGAELGRLKPRMLLPPEKCAMRPPSNRPAKITTMINGNSGKPLPPFLRGRCGGVS